MNVAEPLTGRRSVLLLAALGVVCLGWNIEGAEGAAKKHAAVALEARATPQVYLVAPPLFLQPQHEQFFVAIAIPYDLFYQDGAFYLHEHNAWFTADFFDGPWERIRVERLPTALRGKKIHALRELRDRAGNAYAEQKDLWPKNAQFIPENIGVDDDSSPDAESEGSEFLTPDFDPDPGTLIRKEDES